MLEDYSVSNNDNNDNNDNNVNKIIIQTKNKNDILKD